MTSKLLMFAVLIMTVAFGEGRAASVDRRPTIISYDPHKMAPATMVYEQVKGVLSAKHGCIVLRREKSSTVLLNFRQPAQLRKKNGAYYVDHEGRHHELGHTVTLTGQMGGWRSDAFARSMGVPAACRDFAVFAVM